MATRVAQMATLGGLPTEVISMILKYVLPEDLENFAGTCRTTALAAQPSLEVHRDLIRKYAISKNDALVEGSIGKLVEEVCVDRIGHYVIWLECSDCDHHSYPCYHDEHPLAVLPRFLPNLKTFTLDWPHGHLYHLKAEVADAPHKAQPTLTRLDTVHLRCNGRNGIFGVQVDLVQIFSVLPSVRHLSIIKLKTAPRTHGLINPSNSNVITLDLWNCSIDLSDLHEFLQGFMQLQSFSYSMPASSGSSSEQQDTTFITRGLLNSKLTLRKLVVVAPAQRVSTIGSLTDFQALKQLQTHLELLPSLHLRGNGVPPFQLPDSLQILQLQSNTYTATKYVYLIELAISRKSSTRCQLRVMMLAFLGDSQSSYKPRMTTKSHEVDELKARCRSVGIVLSFFDEGWPTGP